MAGVGGKQKQPASTTPMTPIHGQNSVSEPPADPTNPITTTSAAEVPINDDSSGSSSPTSSDTPPTSLDSDDDASPSSKDKGKGKAMTVDEEEIPTSSKDSSERYASDDPFMLDRLEAAIIESRKSTTTEPRNGESSRTNSSGTVPSTGSGTPSTSPDQIYGEFWPRGSAQSAAQALVRLADRDYRHREADLADLHTDTGSSPPLHSREPFLFANPRSPELSDLLTQAQTDSISTTATRASSPSPLPSEAESVSPTPSDSASNRILSDAYNYLLNDSFVSTYEPFSIAASRAFASRDGGGDAESDLPSLTRSADGTVVSWIGSELTDLPSGLPSLTSTAHAMVEARSPFVQRPASVTAGDETVVPHASSAPLPMMQQLRDLDGGDDDLSTVHWDDAHWPTPSKIESPDPFVQDNEHEVVDNAGPVVPADETIAEETLITVENENAKGQDITDVSLELDDINPFSATPITDAAEAAEIADVSVSLDTPPAATGTATTQPTVNNGIPIRSAQFPVVRRRRNGELPIRRHALRIADLEMNRAERAAAFSARFGQNSHAGYSEGSSVESLAGSSVGSTVQSPVHSPVLSPIQNPFQTPVLHPVQSPVNIPVNTIANALTATPPTPPLYYWTPASPSPPPTPPITPSPPNMPVNGLSNPSVSSFPSALSTLPTLNSALSLTLSTLRGLGTRATQFWHAFLTYRFAEDIGAMPGTALVVLLAMVAVPLMSLWFPYDQSLMEVWRRWFGP